MTLPDIPDTWFRQMVDSSPDATILIDADGTVLLASRRTEAIFGYAPEELAGQSVDVLVPAQYRAAHAVHRDSYFTEPVNREMGANLELTGVRKDGIEFPVEISLSPLRTDNGILTVAAVRDASSRRRAQQQMARLLETAPDAMVMINRGGTIELVNAQTEKLFGYDRRALIGKPVEVLVPERLRHTHTAHRETYVAAPKVREMGAGQELQGRRKNGTEFPIEISLSPMETDTGLWVTAAIRDISYRKQVERKLQAYAAQLERSNRELEDFAHVAAHDLKAPLRNILSFAQLLERELKPHMSEEALESYQFLDTSVRHMSQLIEDLLELGQIGQSERKPEQVPLATLVDAARDNLHSIIEQHQARITTGPLHDVCVDTSMMVQVFQNLIGNAIKFQRPSTPPEILISSAATQQDITIHVTDNGIGIADEHQENVFDIFTRLNTVKHSEGSGIGLAICRKVIERHGGQIGMKTAPSGGCDVWITLPAQPAVDRG